MEAVFVKPQSGDSYFKADPTQQAGVLPQSTCPSPQQWIHNRLPKQSIYQMFSKETELGREATRFSYQWLQGTLHIYWSKLFDKSPSFHNYLSFHIPLSRAVGDGPRATQKDMCSVICILFALAPVYGHKRLTSHLKVKLGGDIAYADFDWENKSLSCFQTWTMITKIMIIII